MVGQSQIGHRAGTSSQADGQVSGWRPRGLLPPAATFPILVFVGLEIGSQSFRATPVAHFPAVALAILPALAYLALIPVDQVLAGRAPPEHAAVAVQSLRCLSSGFIVTSLLWASALAAILDGRLVRAAACFGVAAACSLFGIIHSPLVPAAIALPHTVLAQMPHHPAILCQSPYHWAGAYALAAVLLLGLSSFQGRSERAACSVE